MANSKGTVVASGIVPLGSNPTHYDTLGQGGLSSVATIVNRNAITINDTLDEDGLGSGLRKAGMQVKVLEDGLIYELSVVDFLSLTPSDKLSALANDNNWKELKFGSDIVIEQNLTSNSITSVPSVKAVNDAVNAVPTLTVEQNLTSNSTTSIPSTKAVKTAVDLKIDKSAITSTLAGNSATAVPSVKTVKGVVDLKVDKVTGQGLSDNNFTNIDKDNLSLVKKTSYRGIEIGIANDASTGANPDRSVAIGLQNTASQYQGMAIGFLNSSTNIICLAIGIFNQAKGIRSQSIGVDNISNNTRSITLGTGNVTNADDSIAMGYGNVTNAGGQVVISGTPYSAPSDAPQTAFLQQVRMFKPGSVLTFTAPNGTLNTITFDDNGQMLVNGAIYNSGTTQPSIVIEQDISSNSTTAVPSVAALRSRVIIFDTLLGNLSTLQTDAKSSAVAAINELYYKINSNPTSPSIVIEQDFTSNSTTSVPSVAAVNTSLTNIGSSFSALSNIINNKVDKVAGRGLSEANFTAAEKTKLANGFFPIWYSENNGNQSFSTKISGLTNNLNSSTLFCFGYSNSNADYNVGGYTRILGNGFTLSLGGYTMTFAGSNKIVDTSLYGGTIICQNTNPTNPTIIMTGGQLWDVKFKGSGQKVKLIGTTMINASGFVLMEDGVTIDWYGTEEMPTIELYEGVNTSGGTFNIYPYVKQDVSLLKRTDTKVNNFTLDNSHKGKVIPVDSTAEVQCFIPNEGSIEIFPVGFVVEISQEGSGKVKIVDSFGVTLQYFGGVKTAGQYASVQLMKIDRDVWRLTNGIA